MSSINNSINISAYFSTESSVSFLNEYDEDLELLELEAEREQFSLLFEECLLAQSIDIQAMDEGKHISQKCHNIRSLIQQKGLKSKLRKLKQQSKKRRQSTQSMFKQFKYDYCVDSQNGEWQEGGKLQQTLEEQPIIPQQQCTPIQGILDFYLELLETNIQNNICNNCQISGSKLMNALDIPLSSKLSLQI